jgi:HK97 family phage prohead protease
MTTKAAGLVMKADNASGTGIISGYAATFRHTPDCDGDVCDPGCFAEAIKKTGGVMPVLWQHDRTDPIGWGISAVEDNVGLKVEAKVLMDTEKGRYAWSFVKSGLKAGARPGLSIGFRMSTTKSYYQNGVRHLQSIDLVEYSLVTFPCDDGAAAMGAKAAGEPVCACGSICTCEERQAVLLAIAEFKARLVA